MVYNDYLPPHFHAKYGDYKIINAKYIDNYRIWIEFNDRKYGIIDLKNDLSGSVFESLKDKETFKQFFVSEVSKTSEWINGADFALEYLYSKLND